MSVRRTELTNVMPHIPRSAVNQAFVSVCLRSSSSRCCLDLTCTYHYHVHPTTTIRRRQPIPSVSVCSFPRDDLDGGVSPLFRRGPTFIPRPAARGAPGGGAGAGGLAGVIGGIAAPLLCLGCLASLALLGLFGTMIGAAAYMGTWTRRRMLRAR